MNPGLFEIALVIGSIATALFGAIAALARKRSAALLVLNAIFAAWFAYFFVQGLRFGTSLIVFVLGALACGNATVAFMMTSRARQNTVISAKAASRMRGPTPP